MPARIVWNKYGEQIINKEVLLQPNVGQATLNNEKLCQFVSTPNKKPSILLDFGKEMQGGIQIVTGSFSSKEPVKIRIRFGESVSEAMCEIDGKNGATNDHAIRDYEVLVPWLGTIVTGNTGFRFVRIDLIEENRDLLIKTIRAVSTYRDIEYKGSFKCNDEMLNKIWETGAYTVHLNMQEYLWDGIKRDRLVWVGDLHPEVMTINYVFGYNNIVPASLDIIKENTPLPLWMNNISSYSMWWVLIQKDWFYFTGDKEYLNKQKVYLIKLLHQLAGQINEEGIENFKEGRFLDWSSSKNPSAIHAGLHSLLMLTMKAGGELCNILGETETEKMCHSIYKKMMKGGEIVSKRFMDSVNSPIEPGCKQGASLMVMAEIVNSEEIHRNILNQEGARGFSTFYGYYILQAMAKSGHFIDALNVIREYWGAMINLGATTFWEDFNMDWLSNVGRIDEMPENNKRDIHKDFGDYCYKGYRHSLCHGWASGPTPWLSRYVLGVEVVEPGCKTIRITPNLGDLEWAQGTFPTPYGIVEISHRKTINGKIKSKIKAPKEVRVLMSE